MAIRSFDGLHSRRLLAVITAPELLSLCVAVAACLDSSIAGVFRRYARLPTVLAQNVPLREFTAGACSFVFAHRIPPFWSAGFHATAIICAFLFKEIEVSHRTFHAKPPN